MSGAAADRIAAVLCDVGGPIYTDDNFLWAVRRAVDEVRANHGLGPAETADVFRVYDGVRAGQNGSIRSALASELLGDGGRRDELVEPLGRYWTHPPGTAYGDALPFEWALHQCGTTAQHAVHIGNRLDTDIRPA